MNPDALLGLLQRFQVEVVAYVLIGGHAVRLNGFNRNTEDIDVLLPSSLENGRKVIKALSFLPPSQELEEDGSHRLPVSQKTSGLGRTTD